MASLFFPIAIFHHVCQGFSLILWSCRKLLLGRKLPLGRHWCDIKRATAAWLTVSSVTLISWTLHCWVYYFCICSPSLEWCTEFWPGRIVFLTARTTPTLAYSLRTLCLLIRAIVCISNLIYLYSTIYTSTWPCCYENLLHRSSYSPGVLHI